MTISLVSPLVVEYGGIEYPPEAIIGTPIERRITRWAECSRYPCPSLSLFVAETDAELRSLFEQHLAEFHREDPPS